MNLESLLTSPDGFALTTATATQRAICRASTGLPLAELSEDPDVRAAFGGLPALDSLPLSPPKLFTLCAAIRTAKSLLEAARVLRWSQVVDCSRLGPGEIPRIPIVSFRMDQAQQVFDHLLGALLRSPLLKSLLIKVTGQSSLLLRHPSGRPIEVRVVAGSRAGTTLVSRWLAGCVFDEAPRLQGQDDGVVNLDDALTAIQGRILPGGAIDCVGSPWRPHGKIYSQYVERFGVPGPDLVVVVATGPAMHPQYFTPEFCAELELRDPRAYKTDVLAQFADAEDSLLSSVDVLACTRPNPVTPNYIPANSYVAAIDPATRGNAWTLIVLTCSEPGKYEVVLAKQWQGSKSSPLDPRFVLADIAKVCQAFGIDSVWSDQFSIDALHALAIEFGLTVRGLTLTAALWLTIAERLRLLISTRCLSLPPDPVLRSDLLALQRRLTARNYSISLGSTGGDGRHSDYASALCVALNDLPDAPMTESTPVLDDETLFCLRRQAERNEGAMNAAASRLLRAG